MTPAVAVEKLLYLQKGGSEVVRKTIMAAMANAKVKGADASKLVFGSLEVGEGPRLKRGMPVSRGRWHPIVKKMAHLKVVLETKKEAKEIKKQDVKKDPTSLKLRRARKEKKNGTKS
jgi:large subunit ribosomal protein L22